MLHKRYDCPKETKVFYDTFCDALRWQMTERVRRVIKLASRMTEILLRKVNKAANLRHSLMTLKTSREITTH
jgi:hypothetical protein